jgi:hypothetical protein
VGDPLGGEEEAAPAEEAEERTLPTQCFPVAWGDPVPSSPNVLGGKETRAAQGGKGKRRWQGKAKGGERGEGREEKRGEERRRKEKRDYLPGFESFSVEPRHLDRWDLLLRPAFTPIRLPLA